MNMCVSRRKMSYYFKSPIEQFWFRGDKPGPIFLMEMEPIDDARAVVAKMLLGCGWRSVARSCRE